MVRKIFILIAMIFLPQVTYVASGSGMEAGSPSHEQVAQHSCRDCGLKSLVMACKLLEIETTLESVSNLFEPNDDITMYDLYKIAAKEGFTAQWMGLSIDELSKINSPTIVCTTDKHFMVVDKMVGDNVRIIEYEACYLLSKEELQKMWDRCVLILSKPDKSTY